MGCISIWKMFVLCIWLIDLTVGELKSSQISQSGEHDIEFSANPDLFKRLTCPQNPGRTPHAACCRRDPLKPQIPSVLAERILSPRTSWSGSWGDEVVCSQDN